MGENIPKSQQSHKELLMRIAGAQGVALQPRKLARLLLWIQDNCPGCPAGGSYTLSEWHKVGQRLQRHREGGGDVDPEHVATWRVICTALHAFPRAGQALPPTLTQLSAEMGSEQILQEAERKSSVTRPPPCASLMTKVEAPGDRPEAAASSSLEECRCKALEEGQREVLPALQVTNRGPQLPRRRQLSYEVIEDLREAAKSEGLKAPITMYVIKSIGNRYAVPPTAWKFIFMLLMTEEQYTVWVTEYRELCILQALKNIANKVAIDINDLMGEDQFGTLVAHAQTSQQICEQATGLALQALERVPEAGQAEPSFATIHQGPKEPYTAFVDRLRAALSRQVKEPTAVKLLLMRMAVEHANADCRRLLEPIRSTAASVSDLIEACARVGTVEYEVEQLAAAIARQLRMAVAAVRCFNCGQEGHVRRQCPRGTSGPGAARAPSRPCPRCQKGFHWSNQCHSKFDRNGNQLPKLGRSKRGARSGAPQ